MFRATPLRLFLLTTGLVALSACQTTHQIPKEPLVRPTPPAPAAARPLPAGEAEGKPEHLLHEYKGRDQATDAEFASWQLPAKAKRVVVELLILAAKDDPSGLSELMSTHARWGAPDRREHSAQAVFGPDNGRAFLDAVRQVSARFNRKENLQCPPIMPPAAQAYVTYGSEPMWCFYGSKDGLDIFAFKLIRERGAAKIDYVGLYNDRPTALVPGPNSPQPPPLTPVVRRPQRVPSDRQNPNGPAPVGLPVDPSGAPVGTSPAGAPPIGTPPAGTAPAAQPAPGAPPAGTPPAASTPPAGTPPTTPAPAGSPAPTP